ncbi:hypothetical protein [Allobranchiibius sp. GilTou38]|uniref:hypothetical protein n=1 Tax=Allobranchiibius sp. GilTou38 TaxID=2815210 RepID=UPI001AA1A80F|nr:hypothetical protein [Allobranchiibius sp. GilTou38]MBO1766681.1 hypothetical protein [Allobranchiibius sp. GilTou38]
MDAPTLDAAVDALDPAWVQDVHDVAALSVPLLADLSGPVRIAPPQANLGSLQQPVADLIIGSTLVAVKATQSSRVPTGDLLQAFCTGLLASGHDQPVTTITMLMARFGIAVYWDLEELTRATNGLTLHQARHRILVPTVPVD